MKNGVILFRAFEKLSCAITKRFNVNRINVNRIIDLTPQNYSE